MKVCGDRVDARDYGSPADQIANGADDSGVVVGCAAGDSDGGDHG